MQFWENRRKKMFYVHTRKLCNGTSSLGIPAYQHIGDKGKKRTAGKTDTDKIGKSVALFRWRWHPVKMKRNLTSPTRKIHWLGFLTPQWISWCSLQRAFISFRDNTTWSHRFLSSSPYPTELRITSLTPHPMPRKSFVQGLDYQCFDFPKLG